MWEINTISSTSNPFAQQRLEQLLFRFPDAQTWAAQLESLQQLGYRATIVGPRGSGKSTLLRELHRRLTASSQPATTIAAAMDAVDAISEPLAAMHSANCIDGLQTLLIDIPPLRFTDDDFGLTVRQRRQWLQMRLASVTSHTVLLVDGLERLPWSQRLRLIYGIGRPTRCAGLVVTLHQPSAWTRLPIWIRTQPTLELLQTLLEELGTTGRVPLEIAAQLFEKHRGNLREVLREMYDREVTGVLHR